MKNPAAAPPFAVVFRCLIIGQQILILFCGFGISFTRDWQAQFCAALMRGSFSWKVQFLRTNYIFNYADESTCTCFKTAISVFVERRTTNINLSYFSLTLINESCCSKYNCSLKFSLLHILQVCLISFFFYPLTFLYLLSLLLFS